MGKSPTVRKGLSFSCGFRISTHGNVSRIWTSRRRKVRLALREGDVLVRVEALNIARLKLSRPGSSAVLENPRWPLQRTKCADVRAELVISQFQKRKKVVCRRPGGVLCVPCSSKVSWSISNLFPRSYGVLHASSAALAHTRHRLSIPPHVRRVFELA